MILSSSCTLDLPTRPQLSLHAGWSSLIGKTMTSNKPRPPCRLDALFQGLTMRRCKTDAKRRVVGLCTDSRRASPGVVFFALNGLRTDGNSYLEEAVNRGAVAIVSERPPEANQNGWARYRSITYLQVKDSRAVLAEVARRFYGQPQEALDITAVTGTNGKTTVAYLVKHLLSSAEERVGMLGTIQYDLGRRTLPAYRTTPDAVDLYGMLAQMRDTGCHRTVMEVSSHAIAQQRVEGLGFKVAAFLNLTRDHLDYHDTLENYFATKSRIFTGIVGPLPEIAVIHGDDTYGQRLATMLPGDVKVICFGEGSGCAMRATDLRLDANGVRFTLGSPEGVFSVHSHLPGRYNISNIMAALTIAYAQGGNLGECIERLASFPGVPGRMERVDAGQAFSVFVDYAHTDDALTNALTMLRAITPGRLLVVFGCGGNRDREKRPLMTQAALNGADYCWATADNPRSEAVSAIFDDMRQGMLDLDRICFVEDRRRAIFLALEAAQEGDCVLIAGKGHETFQEFNGSVIPFDDRLTARQMLEHYAHRVAD